MDVGQLTCYNYHDGSHNYTSFYHNCYIFGTFSFISSSYLLVSQFKKINFYMLLNGKTGDFMTYLTSPKCWTFRLLSLKYK